MSPEEFVAWLMPEAQVVCSAYDLPVSVCVAQGALESGWGKYIIGQFNIFGRKWNGVGKYIEVETEEFYDGQWQTIGAKFQDYANLTEAVEDWCISYNGRTSICPVFRVSSRSGGLCAYTRTYLCDRS